jgi:hypothetical protein
LQTLRDSLQTILFYIKNKYVVKHNIPGDYVWMFKSSWSDEVAMEGLGYENDS